MALKVTDEAARLAAEVLYYEPLTKGKCQTARMAIEAALPHLVDAATDAIHQAPLAISDDEYRLTALDRAIQARPISVNGEKPSIVALAREFEAYLRNESAAIQAEPAGGEG